MPKLHRNVVGAGIVSLLMDISSEMIYPLVPIFLSSVLAVPKSVIGVIEGVAESIAALLKAYSGAIADRFRRYRLLMGLGYGISTLARPLLALAGSWHSVLAARVVDRVGKGIRTAPRDAIIAASSAPGDYGFSFGFHRAMDTAGAAIGPLLAFCILALAPEDYTLVFWLSIIPAVLAVAVIYLAIQADQVPPSGTPLARISLRGLPRPAIAFMVVIGLFSIGNSSDVFLILRAEERGVAALWIPVVYLIFNVIYALLATPAGVLADRLGQRRIIGLSFPLFAIVYAGFAMATTPWHIPILFGLYGAFMAMTEGVQKAYLATLIPPERRATGFGVFNMVMSVALLPASLIAGLLWDRVAASAPFWFGAATALLAWAAFSIMPRVPMAETQYKEY